MARWGWEYPQLALPHCWVAGLHPSVRDAQSINHNGHARHVQPVVPKATRKQPSSFVTATLSSSAHTVAPPPSCLHKHQPPHDPPVHTVWSGGATVPFWPGPEPTIQPNTLSAVPTCAGCMAFHYNEHFNVKAFVGTLYAPIKAAWPGQGQSLTISAVCLKCPRTRQGGPSAPH